MGKFLGFGDISDLWLRAKKIKLFYQDLAQDYFQTALGLVVERGVPLCVLLCVCGKIETALRKICTLSQSLTKSI